MQIALVVPASDLKARPGERRGVPVLAPMKPVNPARKSRLKFVDRPMEFRSRVFRRQTVFDHKIELCHSALRPAAAGLALLTAPFHLWSARKAGAIRRTSILDIAVKGRYRFLLRSTYSKVGPAVSPSVPLIGTCINSIAWYLSSNMLATELTSSLGWPLKALCRTFNSVM